MLVYDSALDQDDIDDIYNSGLGTNSPPTDDMILWYNFQQATSGDLENQALTDGYVSALPLELDTEHRIWRGITAVSDTQWVMDCDFEADNLTTNNPAFVFCGLSSENHISGYTSPDADVIAMQINDNGGNK